jgi:putative ABC transport system permease protein
LDALSQDVRYAWRTLRARPGFTLVAVLTVALGVGASTSIFSAVNALLLRPLPIEAVDRLVFGMALREGFDPFGTSLLEYAVYRDEARSFVSSGLGAPRSWSLVGSGEPERLRGSAVMAGYLRTLGVKPILGRLFADEDDRSPVLLLGHELWRRRFGGDPGAVGQSLTLDDTAYSVIGVLPPGFNLPYSAEVWVPMPANLDAQSLVQRAANAHELVARLKPGISLREADTELKGLARRLEQAHPEIRRGWSYGLVPLRHQLLADLEGRGQRLLGALGVAVGFLLLICCANVASLLLARGVSREAEMAIRLSLGAARGRLVRQLLTESLVLAFLGGVLGVLLATWIQPLLGALNPIQATGLAGYLGDFRIDGRVLLFSLAVTLFTGTAFGLVPAMRVGRSPSPMRVLQRGLRGRGGTSGGRPLAVLVIAEVAVAATLLVAGGLVLQSFQRLQRTELGYQPDRLLTMELPLSPYRRSAAPQQVLFMEQILERVRALPGVASAGITLNLPLQRGVTLDAVFEVEGRPRENPSDVPITAHRPVSPGYLETLGVTLVRGRLLDERDRANTVPVAVVSEELVRQSWPGEDPLGKRVRRLRAGERGPWMTVVGVVRDVKEDRFGFRIDRPAWYLPYAQQTFTAPVNLPLNLVLRAEGDPLALAGAVREAIRQVDPHQPVASVMPMREYLSDVLVAERFSALLMGALAAFGLLLAALGLYGVMAYTVNQRTGEIGVRMALGARPADVFRQVLGRGATLVAAGLGLGVTAAWMLTRMLASSLYQVSASDPATFAFVALALAGTAAFACWLPARRAMRISPMAALRSE